MISVSVSIDGTIERFSYRYDFSFSHFAVRNWTMASVPVRKRSRLRQMESSVYALEMVAGSLGSFGQNWVMWNIVMYQVGLTGYSRYPELSSPSPSRSLL